MKMQKYLAPVQWACYDNDCYIPEKWALESLAILNENMLVANKVHRDFETDLADYGDQVHTRRPAESKIKMRSDDTVASGLIQSTSSTDVPVILNRWANQSFTIKPGEMSKAFADLVNVYLRPRVVSIARTVDRSVLGRMAASFGTTNATRAGHLSGLTAANAYESVVELDQILNTNKAPDDGRSLLLSASAKAQMLLCDKFVKSMERGDGSSPITTAKLGTILNFETFLSQNVNSVLVGGDITATFTTGAAYAAEKADALAVTGIEATVVGEYCVVVGNDQPTYVTAKDTNVVTLSEPLKYGTGSGAKVTRYKSCSVSTTAVSGWGEGIVLKSYTTGKAPQVGQLLAFCDASTGANRHTYTVIESTDSGSTCEVVLDRPLERTITQDSTVACPGPYGSINPAFHRNALALVVRPLASVAGAGMACAVVSDPLTGLSVRVAIQDVINVGRTVAIDMLYGVAVLDSALCVPLLG
jgi:hypothetical protein